MAKLKIQEYQGTLEILIVLSLNTFCKNFLPVGAKQQYTVYSVISAAT